MELNFRFPCWQTKAQTKQPLPTLLRWMKVCCGYAFRRRYENRLLSWVLKRALCLKWQMPLWQRISQTLKVEVGFGSSVWSSFFHLKKGPSKGNFNTWHAAFPSLFQPCKQRNNQWQQREGRQEKHVKQLAFPFIQCWAAPQGWGFLLFIIILFLFHIFCFLPGRNSCFLQRAAWK